MSTKDYSAKLLEMEGVRIENLEESEKEIVLQISLERRTQICSHCGAETERVHDYRIRYCCHLHRNRTGISCRIPCYSHAPNI